MDHHIGEKLINTALIENNASILKWTPSVVGDAVRKRAQNLGDFVEIVQNDLMKGHDPEDWMRELVSRGQVALAEYLSVHVAGISAQDLNTLAQQWEDVFDNQHRAAKDRLRKQVSLLDPQYVSECEELLDEAANLSKSRWYHEAINLVEVVERLLDVEITDVSAELKDRSDRALERIMETHHTISETQQTLQTGGMMEFVNEFMDYANRLVHQSHADLQEIRDICDAVEILCHGGPLDEGLIARYRVQFQMIQRNTKLPDLILGTDNKNEDFSLPQFTLQSTVLDEKGQEYLSQLTHDNGLFLEESCRRLDRAKSVTSEIAATQTLTEIRLNYTGRRNIQEFLEGLVGLLNYWSNRKTHPQNIVRDLRSRIIEYYLMKAEELLSKGKVEISCEYYSQILKMQCSLENTVDERLIINYINSFVIMDTLSDYHSRDTSRDKASLFANCIDNCLEGNSSEVKEKSHRLVIALIRLQALDPIISDHLRQSLLGLSKAAIERIYIGIDRLLNQMSAAANTKPHNVGLIEVFDNLITYYNGHQENIHRTLKLIVKSTTSLTSLAEFPSRIDELGQLVTRFYDPTLGDFCNMLQVIGRRVKYYLIQHLSFPEQREALERLKNNEIPQLYQAIGPDPGTLGVIFFIPIAKGLEILVQSESRNIVQAASPELRIKLQKSDWRYDGFFYCDIEFLNQGQTPAHDIKYWAEEARHDEYKSVDSDPGNIALLYPGDDQNWVKQLRLEPMPLAQEAGAFTLYLNVEYSVAEGASRHRRIHPIRVNLPHEAVEHETIANPYIVAGTLSSKDQEQRVFFGRANLMRRLGEIVAHPDYPGAAVIVGQKRSGKTSLLFQLGKRLNKNIIPVMFDIPTIVSELLRSGHRSTREDIERFIANFLYALIKDIKKECRKNNIEVADYKYEDLINPPGPTYQFGEFLSEFNRQNPNLRLLLMLDEFGDLMGTDQIDFIIMKSIKSWIDRKYLSCIICGLTEFYDTVEQYANQVAMSEPLFVDYLEPSDARKLILEPIRRSDGSSRLVPEGIERDIIELTQGNPFYLQIFCKYLVDFMNQQKISTVTAADINRVREHLIGAVPWQERIEGINALPVSHFENLCKYLDTKPKSNWTREQAIESLVIRLLAYETQTKRYATVHSILQHLDNAISEQEIEVVLRKLLQRQTISRSGDEHESYRIHVELFKQWLVKNREIEPKSIRYFLRDMPKE